MCRKQSAVSCPKLKWTDIQSPITWYFAMVFKGVLEDAEVKLQWIAHLFCCASRFWCIGIDGLERTMLYEEDTQV